MRLGSYPCRLHDDLLERIYNAKKINEVHRHRYEFNNKYREQFESKGMKLSGLSPDGKLVEIVRNENVPFLVGCQYHPEFKSYPSHSEPLFNAFIYYAKNTNRVKPVR
jgi:CTP synthase